MVFVKSPKKSLGQNFLIDKNIIKKILNISNIDENQTILEIGAGYGNLTELIAKKKVKKIIAVEKDIQICEFLKNNFKNNKNIKIINDDILNVIKKINFGKNIIVFGNLPYNISTKILSSLILTKKWPPWYKSLIFMFQKEVADRISAKTNSKEFGRLTVLANWRLDIKKHFNVSNNCFYPRPKVDSTVLSFIPKKDIFKIKNPKNLEKVTRILFSSRRKMINKSFIKLFNGDKSIAKKLDLNLNLRPGEINNEMYYKITLQYENLTY